MKKIGLLVVIIVLFLFYERSSVTDLSKYQLMYKQVEIKGEVVLPGIYEMPIHANVQDVINKAGGINETGDVSNLNLTKDIANHDVIVVSEKHEEKLISINNATLEELDTLPGIGPSIAQRIIDYRNTSPFQSIEDLKQVKGIGDKLFEKIVGNIIL